MWLIASRCVSWTTCVYTSIAMLIWLWPRISITTRGGTPSSSEQCGASVPGVMETDDPQAVGDGYTREGPVHVVRLDRPAVAGGEDVPACVPRLPHRP